MLQILMTGPVTKTNRDGTQIPEWLVGLTDENRRPKGWTYHVQNLWKARLLAASMADDRKLPLEQDWQPV